ncbi:MAG: DUF58 domain-containing protein [Spirochaetia bacterium]|jgi:uncharacterized protein (DUF58 family)|nr:DUF58 domain-containing protein [Spirochaetia bacterium]
MKREEILSEIKKIELVTRKSRSKGISGLYRSLYRGRGIELAGLREYTDDDDFRMIDWNAFAKTGKPFTRVTQEERDLELYLLVDISSSMAAGGSIKYKRKTKLETAAVISALLGFSATINRDKTGAVLFSGKTEELILPASGRNHVFAIAEKILDFVPLSAGTNLDAACSALPDSFRKNGICVIISDMQCDVPWKKILKISSRTDCVIFRITDPFEHNPLTSFSFNGWNKDLLSTASREHFLKPASRGKKLLLEPDTAASQASKLGILMFDISTSDILFEKINVFFKMRK